MEITVPPVEHDLNDLRHFVQVVDSGGFSAAARVLGVPKSRLSRRLAGLEARLGVRLLQRSTRSLTVTEVGMQVLAHARAMVSEAQAAACAAARVRSEPSGPLRVSMPGTLLETPIAEVLLRFAAAHPKVTLQTVLTTRRVDPVAEGIDLALRVRTPDDEDPQWPTRRLMPARSLLVASPGLVAQFDGLATPEALAQAPALGVPEADRRVHWDLLDAHGTPLRVSAPVRLATEHFGMRHRAAVAGLGVTLLPENYALMALAEGTLQRVLPAYELPMAHFQAVYATQRGLSPAVRTLLDALAQAPEMADLNAPGWAHG